jgi:hypothetical protein
MGVGKSYTLLRCRGIIAYMRVQDLYWLAGLCEGEASFWLQDKRLPRLNVGMTDLDVMKRVGQLLGATVGNPIKKPISKLTGVQGKDFYQLSIGGKKAAAWMMTLFPLLGIRRREKITTILQAWRHS